MLRLLAPHATRTIVRLDAPARTAVVSWHADAPAGRIDLTVYRVDGQVSRWLPYVEFSPVGRRSLCGGDDVARIAADVVESEVPMAAIEVRADVDLASVAVSTPVFGLRPPRGRIVTSLDVPPYSQYCADHPNERGWCSPTSLAMLLAYWGKPHEPSDVARAVFDERYGGTGNWAFNVAYANRCELCAVVAHLEGLDHAAAFIAAKIPLALSFSWTNGALPGAPLDHSDGHLAVLRGFSRYGHPQFNDPAHPDIVTTYDRKALERAWLAHGGVAFALVPETRRDELLALANA